MNFPPTCRGTRHDEARVAEPVGVISSEDNESTELNKEHHSRSAGLDQRLAEAERDAWESLIRRAHRKQQDEDERKNTNSNQLEDREQAYLRRVNRAIFKANNGCLRAARQIMLGSTQAPPGEETTKMIRPVENKVSICCGE